MIAGDYIWIYDLIETVNASNASTEIKKPKEMKEPSNLWKKRWNSGKLSNPIHFASYSPNGSMFATLSKHDKYVKVWSEQRSSRIDYEFVYLSHPQIVLGFSWRNSPHSQDTTLLTNCKDSVSRIWTPVSNEFDVDLVFHVAAFITLRPDYPKDQSFVCHWLHSMDILLCSLHRNLVIENKQDYRKTYQIKSKTLKKMIREHSDAIMHVGYDGSITVWGIQVCFILLV